MEQVKNTKKILSNKRPEKSLILNIGSKAGRNWSGRITVRHRGGGVKRFYRIIDFSQSKIDVEGTVLAIEYDPYRTSYIALIEYEDKEKKYIIAPQGLNVGDKVIIKEKAEIKIGNRMRLKNIPVGTMVHNVELESGRGGKIVKSAGSAAIVLAREGGFIHLSLPSTEVRMVKEDCFASIGSVSNPEHKFEKVGKAGTSRYMGRRPEVRGLVMNPVDHHHGGGEGRTGIGMPHPKTPWGKNAFGVKTRKRKKWSNKYIMQRRKKQ